MVHEKISQNNGPLIGNFIPADIYFPDHFFILHKPNQFHKMHILQILPHQLNNIRLQYTIHFQHRLKMLRYWCPLQKPHLPRISQLIMIDRYTHTLRGDNPHLLILTVTDVLLDCGA